MTRLRNLLLTAGLGLALYSTPSYAQESIFDRVKDRVKETTDKAKEEAKKARERARRAAERARGDYQKTREQLSRTRKKLGETARKASEFTREATRGKSLGDYAKFYKKGEMETVILVAKNIPVINTETGKITTFNTLLKEMTASEEFEGTAFKDDPLRVAATLIYDPESAFSKYEIIPDFENPGKAFTMDEAIAHLNKQQKNLMRELGGQPTRSTQTSTKSIHKRHSTSSRGLEKVIDKEFTLRERYEQVYDTNKRRMVQSPWWHDLDERLDFGDKTIRLSSNTGVSNKKGPVKLDIFCNAKGNNATNSSFSLISQKDSTMPWLYSGNFPSRGAEYTIYNSDDGKIKLRITDYQYSGSGDDRAFKSLSFKVTGFYSHEAAERAKEEKRRKELEKELQAQRLQAQKARVKTEIKGLEIILYSKIQTVKGAPEAKKLYRTIIEERRGESSEERLLRLRKEFDKIQVERQQIIERTTLRISDYLNNNPGSRLLDISILFGSSSKAKDGLSYLLEQRKIKIQDHKYYPTK